MTVNRLHKILSEAKELGYGHRKVCVSKETFRHNLEADGCTILDAWKARIEVVPQIDGDGGLKENKDGSQRELIRLVLYGTSWEPTKREERGR